MINILILRWFVFLIGLVCLGLGLIGVVVRGLPTTPFLLLATLCFSQSSERMNRWILTHPRLGPFVRDIRTGRGVSLRVKVVSLVLAWLFIGAFAVFLTTSTPLRVFLILLVLTKTVLMIWVIPTKNARRYARCRQRMGDS